MYNTTDSIVSALTSHCPRRRDRAAGGGWTGGFGAVLLAALLFAVGLPAGNACAQQPTGPESRAQADGGGASAHNLSLMHERLERLRHNHHASPPNAAVTPAIDLSNYGTKNPVQSWALTDNPEPQLNFSLLGTPQRAGDVSGDGTNDYLYTASARDERTPSDLEDRTGKTALYFGGDTPEEPDQLLYHNLRPAGDLNGDNHADAIEFEDGSIRFWEGSSSGYADTGTTIDNPFGTGNTVGFTDLDGDGFEDVLLFRGSAEDQFAVVYGGSSFSQANIQTYSQSASGPTVTLNAADLTGDGSGEVVRLAGQAPNMQVQVLEIDDTRALTEAQSFVAEELEGSAEENQLSLIDITGNDSLEVATTFREVDNFTYAFSVTGENTLSVAPVSLGKDDAIPVGDLDGDGRHDFYTFNESTDTRYISYGPTSLSQDLTFDTEIPYGSGVVGRPDFVQTGSLGDVTGDGRPDAALNLIDNTSETVGRRFFSVNSDGTGRPPEDVTYPTGRFFDQSFYTSNVGDLNGDGVVDLAIPRRDLGRTEIFFGGDPISQTPDLTLPTPYSSYLGPTVGGDFNGDGYSDIAAVYGSEVDIFFGGSSMDATPDHTIDGADFLPNPEGTDLEFGDNIGDVNDDGYDDLLFTEGYAASNENGELEAFLFFGGSDLPSTPDQTLTYGTANFVSDDYAQGLGDINGDGIDDFALTDPDHQNDNGTAGVIYVYFGATDGPDFSSPDLTITPEIPEDEGYTYFPVVLAGGDFNDDGQRDLAAKPQSVDPGVNDVSIHIYHGGSSFDAEADRRLDVPAAPLGGLNFDPDGNGLVNVNYGQLVAVPRSSGPDGLLLTSAWFLSTNALLYQGEGTEPTTVLRAPNQDAGLGGISFANSGNAAVGDFNDDGTTDLMLTQDYDDNDAAQSSRIYNYVLGDGPSTISGSVEVDAGETGSVPLGAAGAEVVITENNDSDGGQIQFTRSNTRPPNESFDGSATAPDGSVVSPNAVSARNWDITAPELSGLTFKVRLDIAGADGISAPDQLLVVRRTDSGEDWTPLNTTRSGEMLVSSELTSFSSFSVAGNSTDNPLPVEMAGFDAVQTGSSVELTWQTASETNNAGFQVQRKSGQAGAEWTQIGFREGAGTTETARSYRFTDSNPPFEADALTYRLKQVDLDGSASFSAPVTLRRTVDEVTLRAPFPNPTSGRATVQFAVPERQDVSLRLYDVLGRRVTTLVDGAREGRKQAQFDTSDLSSGVYFLRLEAGGQVQTRRVTVVR